MAGLTTHKQKQMHSDRRNVQLVAAFPRQRLDIVAMAGMLGLFLNTAGTTALTGLSYVCIAIEDSPIWGKVWQGDCVVAVDNEGMSGMNMIDVIMHLRSTVLREGDRIGEGTDSYGLDDNDK